jgi:hypothetical protein
MRLPSLTDRLLLPAAVLAGLALMLLSLGHTGPRDLFSFINADSMYFHAMYNDLLVEGNCLWGWDLNTTFNLMPNALLYLLALLLVNDPVISQMVHGLLQYAMFLWAGWYLLSSLRPRPTLAATATALLLPAWFFINAMHHGNYFLAAQFYHPYHLGALIMTCWVGGLNLRQLQHHTRRHYPWIILLVALATFSNRIFLMMFFVPWMGTLAVLWLARPRHRRTLLRNGAWNTLGVAAGILLFILVKNIRGLSFQPTKMFSWDNVWPSFQALWSTYLDFLLRSPVLGGLMLLSLAAFAAIVVKAIRELRPDPCRPEAPGGMLHFRLFTLWLVPVVFLAPAANGMFFSMASARYNFFVMVWLMLCAAPLMQALWKGKPWQPIPHRSIFLATLLLTLGSAAWLMRTHPPVQGLRTLAAYYPGRARCVDQAAQTHHLKDGIGNFWDAKPITALSKEGIRVRQVYPDLRPYYLGASRNWYFPFCEGMPQPVFNFIVHDNNLDPEAIRNTFGQQIDTLQLEQCIIYLVPEFTFRPDRSIQVKGLDD